MRMYATRKRRHNQAAMVEFKQNSEIIERKFLLKLLYNPIEKVKGITQVQLDKVIAQYPQLFTIYNLISDFKALFAAHHTDDLLQWMESAKSLDSPDINSFVNGLSRDMQAVRNAVIYDYNNGLAEGASTKSNESSTLCMAVPIFQPYAPRY